MLRVLHVLDHAGPLDSGHASPKQAIVKTQAAAGLAVRGTSGHAVPARVLREWREIGALAGAIGEVVAAARYLDLYQALLAHRAKGQLGEAA